MIYSSRVCSAFQKCVLQVECIVRFEKRFRARVKARAERFSGGCRAPLHIEDGHAGHTDHTEQDQRREEQGDEALAAVALGIRASIRSGFSSTTSERS